MNLVAGNTLGHYEILGPLGAGGMGEVYRARDKRLGRDVAIKVLPPRLASDPQALARFEREAKSLASLSHPNILTIHDFGTENGVTYAVMELLEGESLRSRIARSPLAWSRVVEIGLAIANGLAAAHSRGIIHRDLKPENIFLTSHGGIKILDFGLVRIDVIPGANEKSALPTAAPDTEPGTVLGTLGYMSPEQLRGQTVDSRSDIFSFGCVLYEMLSGVSPFRRNTAADTMAAVLNSDPPELSKSGQTIPPEMDRVVMHCLEKDPEQRFHSARDLAFDLKEIAGGSRISGPQSGALPAAKPKPSGIRWILPAFITLLLVASISIYRTKFSTPPETGGKLPIAVADFVNETGEKDLDGLSGMLITSLEQSRKLSVLTRSRMFDVLNQIGKQNVERIDENIGREICTHANVSGLVLASIRKFDQLYTIDLKILDPVKNEYIFTSKQEGNGKASIPSMIDKLSEVTRAGLNEKAAEIQASTKKVADVTTTNLEAYQHYFQGEQLINQLKFREAEAEFNKAIALDPDFSLAYFRRTYAISWTSSSRALESAAEAFRHEDKLPEKEKTLVAAYRAFLIERDVTKAIAITQKVVERYPDEKEALFVIGDWAYHDGDYQKAITSFKNVLALDPNFERALQHLCWSYTAAYQYDKYIDTAKNYVQRTNSEEAYQLLIRAYAGNNDFDNAFAILKAMSERYPKSGLPAALTSEMYLRAGQQDKAIHAMMRFQEDAYEPDQKRRYYDSIVWQNVFLGRFREAWRINEKLVSLLGSLTPLPNDQLSVVYGQQAYFCMVLNDSKCGQRAYDTGLPYAEKAPTRDFMEAAIMLRHFDVATQQAEKEIWTHTPYTDKIIRAYRSQAEGKTAEAIEDFEFLVHYGLPLDRDLRSFDLAALYLQNGDVNQAIETLKRVATLRSMLSFDMYPRMIYLLGRAYEQKGDRKVAAENYRKVLEIWKDGDPELPELKDAKARLAKL